MLIMRIEHLFEKADDPTEVSMDLGNFLNSYGFNVISMVEIAFGANMPLSDLNQNLR